MGTGEMEAGGGTPPSRGPAFKEEKYYRVTIRRRDEISPDLWIIRVDPGGDFRFLPGQYATLGIAVQDKNQRPIERPYSIASSPKENELEFFLELVPLGGFTPLLHKLHAGNNLLMRKIAKGRFMLNIADPSPEAPQPCRNRHFLVSTVTGVAPFVSYIRTLHRDWQAGKFPGEHKLYLLHGASRSLELGYHEELLRIAAEVPWLTYAATVSRPWEDPEWRHETGRVDDLIRKYTDLWDLNTADTTAYLCGHPEMISHGRGILQRKGFTKDAIKEEVYWVPPKESKSQG